MSIKDPAEILRQAAWKEIQRLELELYVADLDANGFTVIPPSIASPGDLHKRLLARILDLSEEDSGVRPDLVAGENPVAFKGSELVKAEDDAPFGQYIPSLIFEGPAFEEALLNPVLLAMSTYLCGFSAVLSSMSCFVKGPTRSALQLHADTFLPAPMPAHALLCNGTYVLTEFNRENGATAFVPGSHKFQRQPREEERFLTGQNANSNAVASEAAPGSLVFWHGNTWHGAFNRTVPGLRVSMPVLMARPSMRTEEDLFGKIPQAVLDRNPARFAVLTQQGIVNGWHSKEHSKLRPAQAREVMRKFYEEVDLPNADADVPLYG